jgi:hypothetical protein
MELPFRFLCSAAPLRTGAERPYNSIAHVAPDCKTKKRFFHLSAPLFAPFLPVVAPLFRPAFKKTKFPVYPY